MFSIRKFIRKWKAFRLSLRLLRLIDPKRLEDIFTKEEFGPAGPCDTDGTVTSCLIGIDSGGTWQQSPGVTRCSTDGSDIAGIVFQSKTCPCD